MPQWRKLMNLDLGDTRLLIDTCQQHGLLRNQAAYVLGTVWHESAHTMEPVKETVMPWHNDKFPSDQEVIRRLDNAMARGRLPQVSRPYWRAGDFGRGHVQLTHDRNYQNAEQRTGIAFGSNHDLMLDSENSALVTVRGMKEGWFTGKKLADYITLQRSDFRNARRIINGLDRAADIAHTAREYDEALLELGYGVEPTLPDVEPPALPEPDDATVEKPLTQSTTIWSSIIGALSGILSALTDNPIAQTILVLALVAAAGWVIRERIIIHRR